MNKFPFIIIFFLFLVAAIATFLQGNVVQTDADDESEKVVITATIFPIFDIARNIAGEHAEVKLLVPAGASPHTFEISPAQAAAIAGSDIVIRAGDIDEWALQYIPETDNIAVVTLQDSVTLLPFREFDHDMHDEDMHEMNESTSTPAHMEHSHERLEHDPHFWLSTQNAKRMAEQIFMQLVSNDPFNVDTYNSNLATFLQKLDALDVELQAQLLQVPNHELIVFHDSWQYFENDYNLETLAVVESIPGLEPLPEDVEIVYHIVDHHDVKVIFSEPQLASNQVQSFVEDLGLIEYILDPLGGVEGRESYIEMMRYNANTLQQALSITEE